MCQTGIKYGCWLMDMFERQCNVITQQPDFCTDNWVEDPRREWIQNHYYSVRNSQIKANMCSFFHRNACALMQATNFLNRSIKCAKQKWHKTNIIADCCFFWRR